MEQELMNSKFSALQILKHVCGIMLSSGGNPQCNFKCIRMKASGFQKWKLCGSNFECNSCKVLFARTGKEQQKCGILHVDVKRSWQLIAGAERVFLACLCFNFYEDMKIIYRARCTINLIVSLTWREFTIQKIVLKNSFVASMSMKYPMSQHMPNITVFANTMAKFLRSVFLNAL